MITLQDLQHAVPEALRRLEAIAQQPLPPSGVLAGQGLASVLWDVLDLGIKGPVNDIDVFIDKDDPWSKKYEEEIKDYLKNQEHDDAIVKKSISDITISGMTYDQIKFSSFRTGARVVSTHQVGVMNYTFLDGSSSAHFTQVMAQNVVDAFDINVVSVGIDLSSNQLVCAHEFLDFCNNKIVQIQSTATPAHTLVRLAKKWHGQEITGDVSCDYDQQRKMLEAALLCQTRNNPTRSNGMRTGVVNGFGEKYKALSKKFAAHLPPLKRIGGMTSLFTSKAMQTFDVTPENTLFENIALCASNASDYTFRSLFLNNFHKWYDLLHEQPSINNMSKRKSLMMLLAFDESVGDENEDEDGDNRPKTHFQYVMNALGQDVPEVNQPNPLKDWTTLKGQNSINEIINEPLIPSVAALNDDNMQLFCAGQHHGKKDNMLEDVVASLQQLCAADKFVMSHFDLRADQWMQWTKDRSASFNKLLFPNKDATTLDPADLLSVVRGYPIASKKEYKEFLKFWSAFVLVNFSEMRKCSDLITMAINEINKEVRSSYASKDKILDQVLGSGNWQNNVTMIKVLLSVEPDERKNVGQLIKDLVPLSSLKSYAIQKMQLSVDLLTDDSHLHDFSDDIELIQKMGVLVLQDLSTSDPLRQENLLSQSDQHTINNNIEKWLNVLSDEYLSDPKNEALRLAYCIGAKDVIKSRLLAMPDTVSQKCVDQLKKNSKYSKEDMEQLELTLALRQSSSAPTKRKLM